MPPPLPLTPQPKPSIWHTLRRTATLAAPYFRSEEKWRARAMFAAVVVLNLASVYMLVLLNEWNRVFYDALQNKDQAVFWVQLGRFTYLALGLIFIAIGRFYLTQLLQLRWRAWMTRSYMTRWLTNHTFYRLELARYAAHDGNPPDNPDQRLQEDMQLFTNYSMTLSMGILNAVVTLVSFIGILWTLSGPFSFTLGGVAITIPGFMVWAAVLYCVGGTVITHYIGRPLIGLNFRQQRFEADFRHHLVRVREYSEAIALDHGEPVEREQLDLRFRSVLKNYLALIRKQKNLIAFTSSFGQLAVVFPFLVAAPRYFGGIFQLGQLMQVASAFGRVQDSLSWFVDNYDSVAAWRATADRLTSFDAAMRAHAVAQGSLSKRSGAVDALEAKNLDIALPDGVKLLQDTALALPAGSSVLLQGPSGSGKSTLFRAFAGIWPFASGQVSVPANAMFIPQRPYVPDGALRDALAYPNPASDYSDEQLTQALKDALLPDLASRLDDHDAWSQILSGGEQQRLAIARVLLKKPAWLFADEATSALDAKAEQTLYERLQAVVHAAGGSLVSVAHRPSVGSFHDRRWTMMPQPAGSGARFVLRSSELPTPVAA